MVIWTSFLYFYIHSLKFHFSMSYEFSRVLVSIKLSRLYSLHQSNQDYLPYSKHESGK